MKNLKNSMKTYKEFINEDLRTDTSPKEVVEQVISEIRSLGVKSPFDNSFE